MVGKENIPTGLSWIKAILILSIIGGFFSLILKKTIFYNNTFMGGAFGDILIITSIVIMILIIFGINKRIDTFYKLALIWFSIEILISLITIITGAFNIKSANQITAPIIKILLNSLFIWYLSKRKDYFYSKKPFNKEDQKTKREEKIFKKSLIIIIIIYVVFAMIGQAAYETYKTATIMKEIKGKEVPEALNLCREKSSTDKDYCIYKIVELNKENHDFGNGEVCEEITSTSYKNKCYIILNKCDKISDENLKRLCNSLLKPTNKK